MANKDVTRLRDELIKELMYLNKKRDDLFIRNVYNKFHHFLSIYYAEQNLHRIAMQMPEEMKQRLAA